MLPVRSSWRICCAALETRNLASTHEKLKWALRPEMRVKLAKHIKSVSPRLEGLAIEIFVGRINSAMVNLEFGVRLKPDLVKLRRKVSSLAKVLKTVESTWNEIRQDRTLGRSVYDFLGSGRFLLSTDDRAVTISDTVLDYSPSDDLTANSCERWISQLEQASKRNSWAARIATMLDADVASLADELSRFQSALEECTARASPFRYACIWEIAAAWNRIPALT